MKRVYDLIVYGATGFTGGLVVEYLCNHAPKELRWAVCGRNEAKLQHIQKLVKESGRVVDVLLGSDEDLAFVSKARVVISGVGPYWKRGESVARACLAAKTHYLDYSGEPTFVKAISDELHEAAVKNNVLLVSCCGFDSVPADLGAMHLATATREALKEPNAEFTHIQALVEMKSLAGASGGTLASMMQLMEQGDLKTLSDPYYLNVGKYRGPFELDVMFVGYSGHMRLWTSPSLMASINTRIVRKTESLLQGGGFGTPFHSKGKFVFNEWSASASLIGAILNWLFLLFLVIGMQFRFVRSYLAKKIPPGKGPSASKRAESSFMYHLVGWCETPRGKFIAKGRFGGPEIYEATAAMISEGALSIIFDKRPPIGGCLTPAVAFGSILIDRLKNRGFTIVLDSVNPTK